MADKSSGESKRALMSSKQSDLYELLNNMKIEDRITVPFFALSDP